MYRRITSQTGITTSLSSLIQYFQEVAPSFLYLLHVFVPFLLVTYLIFVEHLQQDIHHINNISDNPLIRLGHYR